ncbi:MAG: WYL domain-containing transcriptional regulator [Oscillospiraceae bacterium]|nr:WYL domain-containing transcriptional regulator [Oscillospiraceae bacterium]
MAYTELIKSFARIRRAMQEFYVYGFKSRSGYDELSGRSYDDARRRIESFLSDHIRFRRTADGKTVSISVNSRSKAHDPLFRAWKAKSFTDGDITLHFVLFDILHDTNESFTLGEVSDMIDERLSVFSEPRTFDESTIRKKLREYADAGIVTTEKQGRTVLYRRAPDTALPSAEVLDFFAETAPCGVVGSYLLDKIPQHESLLSFKHHYITATMDSEVICTFLEAIHESRSVIIENENSYGKKTTHGAVPLRLMISVQSGRQYLMVYDADDRRIRAYRTDRVVSISKSDVCEDMQQHREELRGMQEHMWGIGTTGISGDRMEHIDMTICYDDDEQHIPQRLMREKRCGTVEIIDGNTAKFSADVYDVSELIPWVRTFLCRIVDIHISVPALEKRFLDDIQRMYSMYDEA